jgi:hypothetical protein
VIKKSKFNGDVSAICQTRRINIFDYLYAYAYHLPPRYSNQHIAQLDFQYIGFTKSSKSYKITYRSCTYIIEQFPVTLYNLE